MKRTKQTFKRLLVCLLAMVMLVGTLSLAGCNLTGNSSNSTGNSGSTGSTEKPPVVVPSEPTVTEAINLPRAMAFSTVTPKDSAGVLLKSTVEPDNAYDKTVDWAVSWNNASSTWATGKTVTDYVTVTPVSDGSATCTVKCLKEFGEQVLLTVTSRADETISTTCAVDYTAKTETIVNSLYMPGDLIGALSPKLTFSSSENVQASTTFDYNTKWEDTFFLGVRDEEYLANANSTYSLAPEIISTKYSYRLSDALYNELTSNGVTPTLTNQYTEIENYTTSDGATPTDISFNTAFTYKLGYWPSVNKFETIMNCIGNAGDLSIIVKLELELNYGTYVYYAGIKLNAASMILPTKIKLDTNQLLF